MADAPPTLIASYEDLVAACRARVQALGMNYEILDIIAGFYPGYSTKLFQHSNYAASGIRRNKRHFSVVSFDAYMTALAFDLVVVENPEKVARLKRHLDHKLLRRLGPMRTAGTHSNIKFELTRKHMRNLSLLAAKARSTIPLRKRRELARQAAAARWAKARAEAEKTQAGEAKQ